MSKSSKHLTLILSTLALAALLATSACDEPPATQATPTPTPAGTTPPPSPTPTVLPGDDEDRPPIIVSGGSVHLRAVAKNSGPGTNNDPGEWKYNSGKKLWFLDHGSLMPAKHLLVHLLYGKDSAKCSSYKTEYDVRELIVKYGSGKSFKIFIDSASANAAGHLTADATAKVDDVIPFWLDVGDAGDLPTSVTFVKDVNSNDKDVTCGLEPHKAEIRIYQRIK